MIALDDASFRIEEIFDEQRLISNEDSINISYKLLRIGDEGSSVRQPMMTKLRKTKALSEHCEMMIIQRLATDTKKECFGILKHHSFPHSAVQFLAVEEDHEVHSFF